MNSNTFNIILIAALITLDIFLIKSFINQLKYVKITVSKFDKMRVVFLISGVLCFISIFLSSDVYEYIRSIILTFSIFMFAFTFDGIGPKGIVITGRFIKFEDISGYDYTLDEKHLALYFEYLDDRSSTIKESIKFPKKDSNQVFDILNERMTKKHRRLKK